LKEKSDPKLGELIHELLLRKNIENPTIKSDISPELKIKQLETNFTNILSDLGLDLTNDSLSDTSLRVAKMFVNELFWGLDYTKFPKCTTVKNTIDYKSSFVMERNIAVRSTCEHHLVIIDGSASLAYKPYNKTIGLSKLNRIVEFFAKRPQIQERLTEQIAETLSYVTDSPDVAVFIDAVHYCVKARGIQDSQSSTITFATRGVFSDFNSSLRKEFLDFASLK
jgi:GTP cyclohydrolase I